MGVLNKYLLLISIIFAYSSACFPQSYLPLQTGNKWVFSSGNCNGSPVYSTDCRHDTTVSIITSDTVMPDGLIYFGISNLNLASYKWFRCDTSWVYAIDPWSNTEVPLFNLNSQIGEEYKLGIDSNQTIILQSRDTINIFDRETKALHYMYIAGIDLTFNITLSDKFGFIKIENIGFGGWSYSNLIGCKINGDTYGLITSVNPNINKMPNHFELYQNYPNPFNPSTTISFSLPYAQNAELKIFDIYGKKVTVLVEGFLSTGLHTIKYTAGNLASGIYFYRLKTERFIKTRKFIVLK